jgi:hypothetical protein
LGAILFFIFPFMKFEQGPSEILKPVLIERIKETNDVQNLEQKLSLEQIEQIMEKVEDINAPGNAFSVTDLQDCVSSPKLKSILSDGLLGHSYFWPESRGMGEKAMVNKETWAKNTRVHKNSLVHFNITGQILLPADSKFPIADSAWMQDNEDGKIAVLFDLSKYEEDATIGGETKDKLGSRTFRPHEFNANAKLKDSTYGFTLSHRVPSRFFKGLVIKLVTGEKHTDKYGVLRGQECRDSVIYDEQANKIGKIMREVYQDKSDLLLPIYDHYGNLRWPKKMRREEVKKFIAERDAKNTNKEEK